MSGKWLWLALCLLLFGCGGEPVKETAAPETRPPAAASPAVEDRRPVIVAFGDSLSAGHGRAAEHSYPDFLQKELDRRGYSYRVVNAGVGGDTTGSGLARLDTVIALRPSIVILEFGGNDGLRGLPVAAARANLDEMITALRAAGIRVVLAGMKLPPNYGPDYTREFERIYPELAAKHRIPLIPFLLEGVAGTAGFMQNDGIHPTAQGNRRVAASVFQALEPLL
jgi:acyl-CoA thioesterase-1